MRQALRLHHSRVQSNQPLRSNLERPKIYGPVGLRPAGATVQMTVRHDHMHKMQLRALRQFALVLPFIGVGIIFSAVVQEITMPGKAQKAYIRG